MRVLVVGGGIIGIALAAELLERDPAPEVVLFEAESQVGLGATSKATGGLRHQFSSKSLVQLSLASIPSYAAMMGAGFRAHGYLFVTSDAQCLEAMRQAAALQRSLGVPTVELTPDAMSGLLPGIRTDDLVGGTFCPLDGSGDPAGALMALLRRARSRGIDLRVNKRVDGLIRTGDAVVGVRAGKDAFRGDAVVIAEGAWSAEFLRREGVDVPVQPFRRQVFIMRPATPFPERAPMTVDQDTGWYVHPEPGGLLLFGGTDRDNRPGMDEVVDWDGLQGVLTAATRRVPDLENAELLRGYAGVRALSPDDLPIVGPVPESPGLWLSVGWGGHGFMHAPGAARFLSDLLLKGHSGVVDGDEVGLARFRRSTPPNHERTAF